MAPIYDEKGKLHVFNSIIPKKGSWIKNSKIGHYTADKPEGPYTFVGITFFICRLAGWLDSSGYPQFGQNIGLKHIPDGNEREQD